MKRVVVVGGGVTGLSLAYFLGKTPGFQVSLVESSGRLGGTIRTERQDGYLLEAGPDSFLSEKKAAVELAEELGIAAELIDTREAYRKACVARGRRLYDIPKGFYLIAPLDAGAFFGSPILSIGGKIRALCEPFVSRRVQTGDESLGSFIRRRFGQELLDRIGQPMVGGVYTGDPDHLSLRATFPRFAQLEEQYGSVVRGMLLERKKKKPSGEAAARGPRYGLFLSFREGMETLVRALTARIAPASVHLAQIERLEKQSHGWTLALSSGARLEADALCLTVPARKAAPLLQSIEPALSDLLGGVVFESVAAVQMAFGPGSFEREPMATGLVVPAIENRTLIAATFAHLKYEGRAPQGRYLVRAYVGGAFGKRHLEKSDPQLVGELVADLSDLAGLRAKPEFWRVYRHPDAMVQYTVGHLDRVTRIEELTARHTGLYLTGASYRGVGIPDCVAQARQTAAKIVNQLSGTHA